MKTKVICFLRIKEVKESIKIIFNDGTYLKLQIKDDLCDISKEEIYFNLFYQYFDEVGV